MAFRSRPKSTGPPAQSQRHGALEPDRADMRLQLVVVNLGHPSDKGTAAAIANNRGVELAATGQLAEAIGAYNQAIRENASLAAAYNNRGNAFVHLRRLSEALPSFRSAV